MAGFCQEHAGDTPSDEGRRHGRSNTAGGRTLCNHPSRVHRCEGRVQGQPKVTYRASRATQRAMGDAVDFMLQSMHAAGATRILTAHDSYLEFTRNVSHSILFDTARVPSIDLRTSEVCPPPCTTPTATALPSGSPHRSESMHNSCVCV